MRRSLIVDTSVHFLFHSVLVLSLYMLFAGHNQPGGGFVGGLVASGAVGLRYIAGGIDAVRAASPVQPWTILGAGLGLSAGTGIAPLLLGDAVLESTLVDWQVPGLGTVHATTATVFDSGVYLVVIGLFLMVFEAFGDDPVAPDDAEAPDGPEVPDGPDAGGDA